MSADFEKMIADADSFLAQHILPYSRQSFLDQVARSLVFIPGIEAIIRLGKRLAVDFAIRGQR